MLAIIAAIIFAIAFLLGATRTATNAVFAPASLLLVGLACLALYIAGIGTGWYFTAGGADRCGGPPAPGPARPAPAR